MRTATCMVCQDTTELDLPDHVPFHSFAWSVAAMKSWVMSMGDHGIFLCCPDCYLKAFDRSEGNVGKLRDKFKHLAYKAG